MVAEVIAVDGEVPDSDTYYRAVAPALLRTGQQDLRERYFNRARVAFGKYANARPDDGRGHFLLGETHRLENPDGPDFRPRLAAYTAAAKADPSYALPHKEIGMAQRQQGNDGAARAAFEKYLELDPEALDAGIIRWYMSQM